MAIGICCQWLSEAGLASNGEPKTKNITGEKSLQLGRYESGKYSTEHIKSVYIQNITGLFETANLIIESGVHLFRLSSNLLPLMDRVDSSLWDNDDVRGRLRALGDKFKGAGIRLTTHPGQFVVLSSDSDRVVENSIRELSHHAWVMDTMGLEPTVEYPINIHGGKADREDRLVEVIKSLPENVRGRLTLENDEFAYSLKQLIPVSRRAGVPITFDSHHHSFNPDGLSMGSAISESIDTWVPWVRPVQHLSNSEPAAVGLGVRDARKHSYRLYHMPEEQRVALNSGAIDVEMEFKGKNLGVLPYLKDLEINLI